jgi:hypothetical protein
VKQLNTTGFVAVVFSLARKALCAEKLEAGDFFSGTFRFLDGLIFWWALLE